MGVTLYAPQDTGSSFRSTGFQRKAVDLAIPVITNIPFAEHFVEALSRKTYGSLKIKSWAEYSV